MIRVLVLVTALAGLSILAAPAESSMFSTAIKVNGIGISHYDLDQRQKLLRAINRPGDLTALAEEALINERLYLEEANRLGFAVTDEEIAAGIEEFAARGSLGPEQFLREIAKFGVTQDSFVNFVRAGVAWRKVVSARFNPVVAELGILEVEQALAFQPAPTFVSARISEIALSLQPNVAARSRDLADRISRTVTNAGEFAETARSLSIAESRNDGGSLGWVQLGRMPPNVRAAIQATPVGRVTPAVETDAAVFVFFKHELREESGRLGPETTDYAVLRVTPGVDQTARERANAVIARIDSCADLRAVSREFPRGHFRANSIGSGDESRYTLHLARLDADETAIVPIGGSNAIELLMLCSRRASLPVEQRETILGQKRNEKIEDYASNLLANLRASAIISRE